MAFAEMCDLWDLTVIAAASWLKYICYILRSNINFAKKEEKIIWPAYETCEKAEQP